MTERWRKRLGDLDKQTPSDDLFERAKGGPQLPDEPISGPSTSTRIVTGVAAFLVFALAISVFAIPALRLRGTQREVRDAGGVLLPLWPKRTLEGIQQLQDDANAGSAGWALDPEQVATRFGADVVGLAPVWAYELRNLSAFDQCAGPSSSSAASCTYYPYFGPSSSSASPFRTYSLSQCGPNNEFQTTVCDYDAIGPPNVNVVLYQPFGTGIWAVREVRSVYLQLSTSPGAAIHDQDHLDVVGNVPRGYEIGLGLHVGTGGCNVNETMSSVGQDVPPAGEDQAAFQAARGGLTVGLDPLSTSGCSTQEPGYVYATLTDAPAGGDGLSTGTVVAGANPRLLGFAAVPVGVQLPVPEATTGASVSPTPTSVGWTAYTDPLGWTIDVPESWITKPIDGSDARLTYQGAAFGSAPLEQAPGGPTALSPPPGDVMLMITHREGGPADLPTDDSAFPLSYDNLNAEEGGLTATFRGDGLPFDLAIRFSDTSDQQVQILRHMVASIGFASWTVDDARNGWTAVGQVLPSSTAEWLTYRGEHWYATNVDGRRLFVGPTPVVCSDGSYQIRETGVVGIECPDGRAGDWDLLGHPQPGNSPDFEISLDGYGAIRAWDGTLLVLFTAQD